VANAPTATSSLARRIEGALRDGRFPQAVELARQFAQQSPGPAAHQLLRRAYLSAAEVQVGRNSFREAHALLSEAEKLECDDAAWWQRLADLRADLGDYSRALQLIERVADPQARPRVFGRIADRAMREGPAGKDLMPPDLRSQFDLVRKAFSEYERGQDDAARETLNAIGITSPFLEWKLLLRGLIAWTANDSPRAIENWSRLSSERLPARIAAPFQLTADKSFAQRLPADRLNQIARQADALAGSSLGESLRRLRKQMANEETIPQALETARAIVPELKRVAPDLVPRLANSVYWTLVASGEPEDMPRYSRIFGPPADDPQFYRLQALVMESMRRLDRAHGMWAKYEEWITRTPSRWPGPLAARARALVLERMGRLARDWLADEGDDLDDLDFFDFFDRNLRSRPGKRQPLRPSAEECFRKSAELAPDWKAPAMELLKHYSSQPDKALPAVEELLQRFPTDLSILESAADLYEKLGDMTKAHECLKRALAANPLDRDLREQAAALALHEARGRAEAGQFDGARAALREALDLGSTPLAPAVHALTAAIELRAGNEEIAAKHRESLMGLPDSRIAGPYRLMVEMSRLKFKKKELTPYQTGFMDGLNGATTAGEIAALLDALAQYRKEPVAYRGLKSHEKKIVDRMAEIATSAMPEDDLVRLGLALRQHRLWKGLLALGERNLGRFPQNPYFPFFQAEAMLARRRSDYVNYNIGMAYCRVKKLIDTAKDGRYQRLQEMLDERAKQTPDLDRWLNDRWGW
jgi:tetratricopeptide (TPR) repeat protein